MSIELQNKLYGKKKILKMSSFENFKTHFEN